jgi:hypothetical protein
MLWLPANAKVTCPVMDFQWFTSLDSIQGFSFSNWALFANDQVANTKILITISRATEKNSFRQN